MSEPRSPAGPVRAAGSGPGRRAVVVATVESPAAATGAGLRSLPAGVTGLAVRADLAGDPDPHELRRWVSGPLTYVLRSRRYGGGNDEPAPVRQARLLAAAGGYDLVDLEADHDLTPELLAGIPAQHRRISWVGGDTDLAGLRRRFDQLARVPAALYLLAPRAGSFPAALAPLQLLAALGRADVTAFGTGPVATFTRVLAPWMGAPVVYGSAAGPTVEQLVTDYPFPELPPLERLSGIVGRSLHTTLFVRLLNAAHRELSHPDLFLPFLVPDLAEFHTGFWPTVAAGSLDRLGLPLHALTVAAPYKQAALAGVGQADPATGAAGAANLLLRQRTGWRATTTDGSAVQAALAGRMPLAGAPAAVVGCGAAGRAAAAALVGAGARVTLVNRGESRGRRAAAELELPLVRLAAFRPERYAVLVHATPLTDRLPFPMDAVPAGTTVADFVCAAGGTALVAAARERGLATVDGREVLAQEVRQQFQLMTGRPLPAATQTLMEAVMK